MDSTQLIKSRAGLFTYLREFFAAEELVEVDTPLLYSSASPEPYLHHLSLSLNRQKHYLQSSPEFAMKRLLAESKLSMFQICKAFRDEESGSRHLPEFTLLEWYMLDWQLGQLVDQVSRLLQPLLGFQQTHCVSYGECFQNTLSINPHLASLENLHALLKNKTSAVNVDSFTRDECLHLLFADVIEPALDKQVLSFVYDFPASQAALATVVSDEKNQPVAKRFEVFFGGMELANAYQEETSADELRQRFEKQNLIRKAYGAEVVPVDEGLLEALENGFPECAGIALGVDRLLMLTSGSKHIRDVVWTE